MGNSSEILASIFDKSSFPDSAASCQKMVVLSSERSMHKIVLMIGPPLYYCTHTVYVPIVVLIRFVVTLCCISSYALLVLTDRDKPAPLCAQPK